MDPNQPAQNPPNPQQADPPYVRPMNEPHNHITEAEMNGQMHQESPKSAKGTLLTLLSLLILAGVVGTTLYLYIMNRSGENEQAQTPPPDEGNEETPETATVNLPDGFVPVISMTPEETLEKHGVVCRRFTSIEAALAEAQVACELDLSGQNLSTLPSGITELKNLNSINLSSNNFSTFPEALYNLPNLINIDLSNNNLSEIPEDILTKIPTLQGILLEGNNLPTNLISQYSDITSAPPNQRTPKP